MRVMGSGPGRRRVGVTVLELLVVVSMLGILLAIGAIRTPVRGAQLYANDVRAILQQGRFEAIKRNEPVAVVWNPNEDAWQTLVGDPREPCAAGTVLAEASRLRYPRVTIQPGFLPASPPLVGNGVVWIPTGQPRGCNDFAPLAQLTIATVSDGDVQREVVISGSGRVVVR